MVPESEIKVEGHRKSGHQMLDLIVAGTALFISCCSLGLAIHSGRTMERLVEANSRPELLLGKGNVDPDRSRDDIRYMLHFQVENPGAGSARVEWMSLEVQGKEAKDWDDALRLLRQRAVASGSPELPEPESDEIVISNLSHSYVKPGSNKMLFSWPRTDKNAVLWDAVNKVWDDSILQVSACYCSIFDQCWVARSGVTDWPEPVKNCAAVRPKNIDPQNPL